MAGGDPPFFLSASLRPLVSFSSHPAWLLRDRMCASCKWLTELLKLLPSPLLMLRHHSPGAILRRSAPGGKPNNAIDRPRPTDRKRAPCTERNWQAGPPSVCAKQASRAEGPRCMAETPTADHTSCTEGFELHGIMLIVLS